MKMKKILIFFFFSIGIFAQTNIKVMSYNLMHFPGTLVENPDTGEYMSREIVLKPILESYQPDLFMVCELGSDYGSQLILNQAMNTLNGNYARAIFVANHSTTDTSLQQTVFYNQNKLTLQYQDEITTNYRDINHYNFRLNTAQDIQLEVFVAHLKSSTGSSNQQERLNMVQQFTNFLQNIPNNHYVIIGGDFNLYTALEPAYTELLDPTNAIVMKDPIDTFGVWGSNSSFAAVHTQSPLVSNSQFVTSGGSWDGVTGGLDDRFDFVLVSENMMSNGNLYYLTGSYHAYGNNGNCYNSYIADPNCSGTYSQELRDLLLNMSDHLPVVLELETPYTLHTESFINHLTVNILGSNMVENELLLEIPESSLSHQLMLYNTLGQELLKLNLTQKNLKIDTSNLEQGMYFLRIENSKNVQKIIKV